MYSYAARWAARRVYAIIGRAGQQAVWSKGSPRQYGIGKRPVALFTVGVDAVKSLLMSRLNLAEKGPGYIHLPMATWCDDEFAAQLVSERLKTKFERGVKKETWTKVRPRNETLDCAVYAIWALHHNQPDAKRRDEWIQQLTDEIRSESTTPPPKQR